MILSIDIDLSTSTDILIITVNYSGLFVLVMGIRSFNHLKSIIWALGLGAVFSAIIPIIFFPEMIGMRVTKINDFEFTGAFWNASVISYMSVGWLLIALASTEKSRIKKYILLGIFLLITMGALAGLSRATFVSLILAVIVFLIVSRNLKKYLNVIIIAAIVLIVSFTFFEQEINNLLNRFDGGIDVQSESRTFIWQEYIKAIPDYFFIGEASGNYTKYSTTGHGPHSAFLNWFTQFGVLAFLGYLILLFGIIKSASIVCKHQSRTVAAGLYTWLVAYLAIATINETGFDQLMVFAGMGIILAWGKLLRKREYKNNEKPLNISP